MDKRYLLLITIPFVLLGSLLVYYFFLFPISVVRTDPASDSKDVSRETPVTIFFDRKAPEILHNNLLISSDPVVAWDIVVAEDGSSISIIPKEELQARTVYTFNIVGKRVDSYSFYFTTEENKFGVGTPVAETAFDSYEKAFPLLPLLPYRTERYTIMQRQEDEYFVIVFGIYEDQIESIKNEVYSWFSNNGVDSGTVKIDFESE